MYSKYKTTSFNADVENTDNFNSFKYKAKLLEKTVTGGNNGILKNATVAVTLKYLSDILRSIEMTLISYKVELKLKWTKYCVLSTAGADNANANPNNIIFTIKDTKLYVPVFTLSAKDNQSLSKLLSKDLKDLYVKTNIKQKGKIKILQTSIDIFLNITL